MPQPSTIRVRRYVSYEEVVLGAAPPPAAPARPEPSRLAGRAISAAARLALGASVALLPVVVARLAGRAGRRELQGRQSRPMLPR